MHHVWNFQFSRLGHQTEGMPLFCMILLGAGDLTSIVVESVLEPLELVQWRRAVPQVIGKVGG